MSASRAADASGAAGRIHLIHGHYLQDWPLEPGDHNWRVDADKGGASRTFADIGSHWCDLAQFLTSDTIESVSADRYVAHSKRIAGSSRQSFSAPQAGGESARVQTEDASADRGALGSMTASQVSAGRKNQLIIETNGAVESVAFDQEHPEDLWRGGRDGADHVVRDPANLTDDARRMSWVSAGHPEGYERCFENFVRDAYAAIRTGVHPVGLPTFADGFRYAQIVDGQCEAELICTARAATWTQVWVWPNTTRHDRPASSRSTLGLSQPSLAQAEVGGLQGRIELPAATAPVLLGVIQFLPERGTTRRHLRNR